MTTRSRTAAERYNARSDAIFEQARQLGRTKLPVATPILVTRTATGETMTLTVERGAYYSAIVERVTERRHLDALLIAWRNGTPDLQFNTIAAVEVTP